VSEEERLYGEQVYPEFNTSQQATDLSATSTEAPPIANTSAEPVREAAKPPISANRDSVRVPKGAVLWQIAEKMRAQIGASQGQMLIALFRTNPDAFYNNNINALKAGATLKFPESKLIESIGNQQGLKEVLQHNERWNKALLVRAEKRKATSQNKQQGGQLTLAAPQGSVASSEDQALLERLQGLLAQVDLMTEQNTSLKTHIADLEVRIQQLTEQAAAASIDQKAETEQQIKDIETQLSEAVGKNATNVAINSAKIEAEVAQLDAELINTIDQGALTAQVDIEEPQVKPATTVNTGEPVDSAAVVIDKTPVKPVVKKPVAPVQKNQSETGFLTDLMESPWAIGSIAGALLLGLIGWQMTRRRKLALMEEMELSDLNASFDNKQQADQSDDNAESADSSELHASKQDSELGDSVFFSEYRPTEVNLDSKAMEVDYNELDPVSEADVYVAYGRYQQAEELIQQALTDHPDRDDYKLKLLEIYHAKDDSAGFAAYVTQLKEDGTSNKADFWARAQKIGTGFAPDNLFGEAPSKDEIEQVEEFSSELFGVDSENESLALNDDLSAILADTSAVDLNIGENDSIQSFDLSEGGETLSQLESAFELDDLSADSTLITLGDNDDFTVSLSTLDNIENTSIVDSQKDIGSLLVEPKETETFTEIGIDFENAITENLDLKAVADSADTTISFDFDSEDNMSTMGFDFESTENLQSTPDFSLAPEQPSSIVLEAETQKAEQETEPVSSIDLEMETTDSLGLLSTDDMTTDSISMDMSFDETELVEDNADQVLLDQAEAESTSEDFQLVKNALDDQPVPTADNESTIFALDDISSELVESAQISEMLNEASQRQSEFAEESIISELFEPASLIQESELFESELSDLDEVADKLDLAKAYIDMEDSESARGILNDVIEVGTDDQKELAKSMVQALEKSA
jgi:pilus assembly protein FimV